LHHFTGKVGDVVNKTIDEPFHKDIDAFVEAIRDKRIEEFKTDNNLGTTELQTIIHGTYNVEQKTVKKDYGYDSIEEFKAVVGHVDEFLNASPKHNIVNKKLAGGEHVKGVDYDVLGFPIFKGEDVKFTHKLDVSLFIAKDNKQFKECTMVLKDAIEHG